jgi:hypothetical protein
MQWTVDHLHKWYGQPQMSLDKDNQRIAASILWMLKGDAPQRAVTVWSAGWKPAKEASNDDWTVPYVAELLVDEYSAIRFMAARSLETSNIELNPHFKFVGPAIQREDERQRIIDVWQGLSRKKQPDRHQRLMFDVKGLPIAKEIDRLIRSRNNQPITISE